MSITAKQAMEKYLASNKLNIDEAKVNQIEIIDRMIEQRSAEGLHYTTHKILYLDQIVVDYLIQYYKDLGYSIVRGWPSEYLIIDWKPKQQEPKIDTKVSYFLDKIKMMLIN